jgi:hypothetical protein
LFLATRGQEPERALNLAERELETRADVLTFDALAWALHASGRASEASAAIRRALGEGTADARLFFHAGAIAAAAHQPAEARRWLGKADAIRQMLLPSERAELVRLLAAVETTSSNPSGADVDSRNASERKELS